MSLPPDLSSFQRNKHQNQVVQQGINPDQTRAFAGKRLSWMTGGASQALGGIYSKIEGPSLDQPTLGGGPNVPYNPLALEMAGGGNVGLTANGLTNNGMPQPWVGGFYGGPGDYAGTYMDPGTGQVFASYTDSMPDPILTRDEPTVQLGVANRTLELLTGVPSYPLPQPREHLSDWVQNMDASFVTPVSFINDGVRQRQMENVRSQTFFVNNEIETGYNDTHWDGYIGDVNALRLLPDTQTLMDNSQTNTTIIHNMPAPQVAASYQYATEGMALQASGAMAPIMSILTEEAPTTALVGQSEAYGDFQTHMPIGAWDRLATADAQVRVAPLSMQIDYTSGLGAASDSWAREDAVINASHFNAEIDYSTGLESTYDNASDATAYYLRGQQVNTEFAGAGSGGNMSGAGAWGGTDNQINNVSQTIGPGFEMNQRLTQAVGADPNMEQYNLMPAYIFSDANFTGASNGVMTQSRLALARDTPNMASMQLQQYGDYTSGERAIVTDTVQGSYNAINESSPTIYTDANDYRLQAANDASARPDGDIHANTMSVQLQNYNNAATLPHGTDSMVWHTEQIQNTGNRIESQYNLPSGMATAVYDVHARPDGQTAQMNHMIENMPAYTATGAVNSSDRGNDSTYNTTGSVWSVASNFQGSAPVMASDSIVSSRGANQLANPALQYGGEYKANALPTANDGLTNREEQVGTVRISNDRVQNGLYTEGSFGAYTARDSGFYGDSTVEGETYVRALQGYTEQHSHAHPSTFGLGAETRQVFVDPGCDRRGLIVENPEMYRHVTDPARALREQAAANQLARSYYANKYKPAVMDTVDVAYESDVC
jgi:hypothetical protein